MCAKRTSVATSGAIEIVVHHHDGMRYMLDLRMSLALILWSSYPCTRVHGGPQQTWRALSEAGVKNDRGADGCGDFLVVGALDTVNDDAGSLWMKWYLLLVSPGFS